MPTDPDATFTLSRAHLEVLTSAATAMATMMQLRQSLGAAAAGPPARVRGADGQWRDLDPDAELPLLIEAVRDTRRALGWMK